MTTPPLHVDALHTSAYTIPTDSPEADGTYAWTDTTLVLVQAVAGDQVGTGWTYGSPVIADLIEQTLAPLLLGRTFATVADAWQCQVLALRNIGRPGIASMAVSAVDCALWDLAARLAGQPLHRLLGAHGQPVPLYGSGGFTSYTNAQLRDQLTGWLSAGLAAVKIKIGESWGTNEARDLERIELARTLIGPDVELFVDANGGYTRAQAKRLAPILDDLGVTWFEEPVSSDDHDGLRAVRGRFYGDVAAGEYGYDLAYFRHLLAAEAVDCVQVDVTRCGGITELQRIAALAQTHDLQISGHCAPLEHAAVLAAVPNLRHLEWFHDHVRIEQMLFTGGPRLNNGMLQPDDNAIGHGLQWRPDVAQPYQITPKGRP